MIETNLGNSRILVVDDQEANLRLMERILKQGGYAAYRSLNDSRQTIAVCQEFKPDLVLLDLMMPHLDGMAVMEQLRPLTAETYLPVLVLTADATPEAMRKALAAGAKDFLTKPFDAVEVLLRIKNLLETRKLYLQLQTRAGERIQEQAALLDHASDAIMVRDLQDRVVYWNRGAERLYGWTAEEAVGRIATELLQNGQAPVLAQAKESVMENDAWEGEMHHIAKDGRQLVLASRWTLMRDNDGRPKSNLVINTDITRKQSLESQLAQAQRLESIGLLAGGVAHDFNNLLTVINGYSDFLLDTQGTNDASRDMVLEIKKAGERAASLTQQLLAFSRKQVLTPKIHDLNEIVTDTEKMLKRLIGEDITLALSLAPQLWPVKVDAGQLGQVIMNLAVNARDAMPEGGELRFTTANLELDGSVSGGRPALPSGRYVVLAVADTGCGMDAATVARIFEPFFTTKGPAKGTGLGLATVHGIVAQSAGHIEVESCPGRGTTFRVYLPFTQAAPPLQKSVSGQFEVEVKATATILLVEDDTGVQALARQILERQGYRVLTASSGTQALQVFEEFLGPIHLLLTDIVLPGCNGRSLSEKIAKGSKTKVLFMSGYNDDAALRLGVMEKGTPFLAKPFSAETLIQKVREVLKGKGPSAFSAFSHVRPKLAGPSQAIGVSNGG